MKREKLMSLADVRREFGLSEPTVARLLEFLPYITVGRKYYFRRRDVEEFMCKLFSGEINAFPKGAISLWKERAEQNGFRCPDERSAEAASENESPAITVHSLADEYGLGIVRSYQLMRRLPHWWAKEGTARKRYTRRFDFEALLDRAFRERADLLALVEGGKGRKRTKRAQAHRAVGAGG